MTSLALLVAIAVGQQFNGSGTCMVFIGNSVGIPAQTGLFSVTPPPQNYWRSVWVDPNEGITPGYIGVTNGVSFPKPGAQVGWIWRIQGTNGYWSVSAAGTWKVIDDGPYGVFYAISYNTIATWVGDPIDEWEACYD